MLTGCIDCGVFRFVFLGEVDDDVDMFVERLEF
jgi:hypothetical protein